MRERRVHFSTTFLNRQGGIALLWEEGTQMGLGQPVLDSAQDLYMDAVTSMTQNNNSSGTMHM